MHVARSQPQLHRLEHRLSEKVFAPKKKATESFLHQKKFCTERNSSSQFALLASPIDDAVGINLHQNSYLHRLKICLI